MRRPDAKKKGQIIFHWTPGRQKIGAQDARRQTYPPNRNRHKHSNKLNDIVPSLTELNIRVSFVFASEGNQKQINT